MAWFVPFSATLTIDVNVGLSVHDILGKLTDEELMAILDGEKVYPLMTSDPALMFCFMIKFIMVAVFSFVCFILYYFGTFSNCFRD
jgi:hypothetical protein